MTYLCDMEREYELSEIENIAAQLIKDFAAYPVWAFYATMGSGKTTLIAAICKQLGYQGNVSSPTFAIMNEYLANGKTIIHMDWYRIEDEQDALRAGVVHAIDSADHCLIEWPEKVPHLIDETVAKFGIEKIDETHRRIFSI